jgi:hypothetical protein
VWVKSKKGLCLVAVYRSSVCLMWRSAHPMVTVFDRGSCTYLFSEPVSESRGFARRDIWSILVSSASEHHLHQVSE